MKKRKELINPYSKLAELHNRGLQYFIRELGKIADRKPKLSDMIEVVCSYLDSVHPASAIDYAVNYAFLAELFNNDRSVDELIAQLEFSNDAKEIIKAIQNVGEEASNEDILQMLNELEYQVDKSELNNREHAVLLQTIAVAKASLEYWSKEAVNKNSLWRKLFGKVKSLPWKADAMGVLVGSTDPFSSLAYGLATGGIGFVFTKVLSGAIVGSISGYFLEVDKKKQEEENKKAAEAAEKNLKLIQERLGKGQRFRFSPETGKDKNKKQ